MTLGNEIDNGIGSGSQGEHRQLAVLFCDLIGPAEISAKLDAEDWREAFETISLASKPA